MKRYSLLTFLLFVFIAGFSQGISVKSFRPLPTDLTPSAHKRIDQNGEVAALIKVVTNETGFVFEGGVMGIVDTKQEVSEVWVWVPRGLRKITIKHPQLGQLRDYYFPVEIESERSYEMVLTTREVSPEVREQFLVFTVTPKDAVVTVNGIPWPMNDGVAQKMVPFGDYEYRIEALDYHTDAGRVKVDDPDNKELVNVTLQPAFGFLKLTGDNSILSQASLYVDNANGVKAINGSMKLGSGKHTLKIVHPKYKPYERLVNITDGETNTMNVNLDANFSTITLKVVDDDAEIWVNNELKGRGSWTGDLEAGSYAIECRKPNHRSSLLRKTITDNMSGESIQLQSPTPINGTLVVNSNPPMAKIVIDGKLVGETPQRINAILIGEHTLRLEKQGCAPVSKNIVIEEGKTLNLEEKLDTGRSVLVKTDRKGDKIYVDDDYVGETPYETPFSFGNHTIKVVRNGVSVSKKVTISENSLNGQELFFEFGKMITINTDKPGDEIMVDGSVVGNSPVCVDLPYGKHVVHTQRDSKYADKDIEVLKDGGDSFYYLVLHGESASDFVKRGVNFVTLDFAYGLAPQTSFGATFGSVKTLGWFVTAASNFNFNAMNYSDVADANGLICHEYSGLSCSTRISAMAGLMVKLGCPLYLKLGAGYGYRVKSWYTTDGLLVKINDDSFSGIDATAGLLLNLKGFTISLDAVTTAFKTVEAKVCLGYCWKIK